MYKNTSIGIQPGPLAPKYDDTGKPVNSQATDPDKNPKKIKKETNYFKLLAQILGILTSIFLFYAAILMIRQSKYGALIIFVLALFIFVMETGGYFNWIFTACLNCCCTGTVLGIFASIAAIHPILKCLVYGLTSFLMIYCAGDRDGPTGQKETNQWYLALPSILCCGNYFYLGWGLLLEWLKKHFSLCCCCNNTGNDNIIK